MIPPHPDIGPPVYSKDIIVGGQKLTAAVDFISGSNKLAFRLMRAGVPETEFTRSEARALLKALQEIINSTNYYGSRKGIY